MEYLFNSISELTTPELIATTSKILKEDQSKVSLAIQTTTASLLEFIIQKGENKKLELLLKKIGCNHILFNISSLFLEEMSFYKQRMSAQFLTYFLKDKLDSFYTHVASSSNISVINAKQIVFKTALLVAGFLGERLLSGIKFSAILEKLEAESNDFQMYIPFEMEEVIEKSTSKAFLYQKLCLAMF